MRDFVMSSESVTRGHPDKLCDQISDAAVDAYLAAGHRTPVSAECAIATGVIFLSIRATDDPPFDGASLARRVIEEAGYPSGAEPGSPTVLIDFSQADRPPGGPVRAGQMTTAFGHACGHTPTGLAYPIWAAHRLTRAIDAARRDGRVAWLPPDAQAQVAVRFRDRAPVAITAMALTTATPEPPPEEVMREQLLAEVVAPAFAEAAIAPDDATRFVLAVLPKQSGPMAHAGLTGRKTGDDTYGGFVRQSASALSGKSPERIDRIASYAARHAARCAVAAGLAAECEVQLSYMIGDESPVTVEVDTFGSGRIADDAISERLAEKLDFGVGAIAERLGLWELPGRNDGQFYRRLASYGHMGRDDLSPAWEDVSLAETLA